MIRAGPGSIMVKRDLKDAFQHNCKSARLVVARNDKTWIDQFLPFGLQTSPFPFDLFAECIHWIVAALLLWGLIFHYLDNFFAVFRGLAVWEGV